MAGRDGREKCSELVDELSEGGVNTFIALVKGPEEKVRFSGIAVISSALSIFRNLCDVHTRGAQKADGLGICMQQSLWIDLLPLKAGKWK